jgi:flagellar protein FliO/FliZ
MIWYLVKLIVLLPLIGAAAWGCLKLAQKMQARMGVAPGAARSVRVIETTMLSPTLKLAVIEFRGREILVSASRQGLVRLAEAPAREAGE